MDAQSFSDTQIAKRSALIALQAQKIPNIEQNAVKCALLAWIERKTGLVSWVPKQANSAKYTGQVDNSSICVAKSQGVVTQAPAYVEVEGFLGVVEAAISESDHSKQDEVSWCVSEKEDATVSGQEVAQSSQTNQWGRDAVVCEGPLLQTVV